MAATVDIVLKGIDNASGVIKSVGGALGGLADIAGGAFNAAMGVATAGVGALAAGMAYGIQQAMDTEKVLAQTEAVIKSTGGAAGMTAEAISDLASALSTSSTFADDAIQSAENLLLTFTNIGAETFPMATQAMVDMAAAMGTDVSSGAIQLGKALNDPIEGISALTRVGVTFTDEQKALIKSLVETGDVAGAQAVILAELNKEFGGSALAQAQTFGGQLDQMKNQFDGIAETVGAALLPVLADLMDRYLSPMITTAYELSRAFAGFIEDVSGGDLEQAIGGLAEWDSIRAVINLLGLGGEAWYQMANSAQIAMDSIGVSLQTVSQNIGLLLSGDMSLNAFAVSLLKIADEYIPGLREQLQPLILAVVGLGEAFAASLPIIQEQAAALFAFLVGQFQMMAPVLIDNLTVMFNTLSELWAKYGDDISRIVMIAFAFVSVTIGGALMLISGLITSFLQVLNGDWTGAWQTITDTTAAFMNMVLSLVGTNLEAFSAMWASNWTMFVQIVIAALGAIGQPLVDAFVSFSTWLSSIVAAVLAIGPQMVSAGEALVNGMISGINNAAASLAAAAVNAANGAVNAAKGALGIKSPSTVFAEIGQNMMAGMSRGIDGAASMPAQSTARAAQSTVSTVNNYSLNMANYGEAPNIPDLFSQQARANVGAW